MDADAGVTASVDIINFIYNVVDNIDNIDMQSSPEDDPVVVGEEVAAAQRVEHEQRAGEAQGAQEPAGGQARPLSRPLGRPLGRLLGHYLQQLLHLHLHAVARPPQPF